MGPISFSELLWWIREVRCRSMHLWPLTFHNEFVCYKRLHGIIYENWFSQFLPFYVSLYFKICYGYTDVLMEINIIRVVAIYLLGLRHKVHLFVMSMMLSAGTCGHCPRWAGPRSRCRRVWPRGAHCRAMREPAATVLAVWGLLHLRVQTVTYCMYNLLIAMQISSRLPYGCTRIFH